MISDAMLDRFGDFLDKMRGRRVLVVGDVLADEYIEAETARVSREAPVLILRRTGSRVIPGGAGNAILNVQALGGIPIPVGVLGEDDMGAAVAGSFTERGIDASSLVPAATRRTVRKTRVMAGGAHGQKQQVLRIDDDSAQKLTPDIERRVRDALASQLREAHAVILSDYGYGTLSHAVREAAIEGARARGIPVCADSRYDLIRFRGVTYATPNESEAIEATRALHDAPRGLRETAERLRRELAARFVIVTCGQDGMVVAEEGGKFHEIPIWGSAEAADVTGAGDTVAAATLLAVLAGADPREAAAFATIAAAIVVQKHGAATASPEEIERLAGIRRKNPQP